MAEDEPGTSRLKRMQTLMANGPNAPLGDLINFQLVEVAQGHAVFEGRPDKSVYNPFGTVHGGYAAARLDSACGIAANTMLGPNRGSTTLELKVSYLKGLSDKSDRVRATGTVKSIGSRVAFVEAELHDEAGKLCATASSTLLLFDIPPR